VFHASAKTLAKFFKASERSIYRALSELETLKFFIDLDAGKTPVGKTKRYQPVSHTDWQKSNPRRCAEKELMPWDGEGDPLGRTLHAMSGDRVEFKAYQINAIRRNMQRWNLTEDNIKNYFPSFLTQMEEEGCKPAYIPGRLIQAIKILAPAPTTPLKQLQGRAKALVGHALASGHVCQN
jgi:hypothetical protein